MLWPFRVVRAIQRISLYIRAYVQHRFLKSSPEGLFHAYHQWISSMDMINRFHPWISSIHIIKFIIHGYHPWISSMDFIHEYQPWISSMGHGPWALGLGPWALGHGTRAMGHGCKVQCTWHWLWGFLWSDFWSRSMVTLCPFWCSLFFQPQHLVPRRFVSEEPLVVSE